MKEEAQKLLIGAHTSTAGGLHNALLEGQSIGATTVQLFTSNQRQWKGRQIDEESLQLWQKTLAESGISDVMSHDSYLINLGSPDPEGLHKSREAFAEEVQRCLLLGLTYLNFHPGASLKGDPQQCLDTISKSILGVSHLLADSQLTLLLETTAGQGSTVGYAFEQLAYIIGQVGGRVPLGVCVDTCHIFAAGYDLTTKEACGKVLEEFDAVIGLKYLRAFHLNDSLKGLGSKVDRHQPLGKGMIGIDCFNFLMSDPRTRHLPKYLETPDGPPLWKEEIKMLREMAK